MPHESKGASRERHTIKRATASRGQVNPWSWRGHEPWRADDNPAYEKSPRPTVASDHGIINLSRSSFFLHSSTCSQEPLAAASRGPPWASGGVWDGARRPQGSHRGSCGHRPGPVTLRTGQGVQMYCPLKKQIIHFLLLNKSH